MKIKNKNIISFFLILVLIAVITTNPHSANVKAGIFNLWQGKTEYTLKDNEQDKVEKVTLTYIFNNEIHADYSSGTPYETDASTVQTYEEGNNVDVKNIDETFSGYIGTTGACEFIEWNTQRDGTGTTYTSGTTFPLTKNITLYGIWKSCKPEVLPIYEFDSHSTGTGAIHRNSLRTNIEFIAPDGVCINTAVTSNGTWNIAIPARSIDSILSGEEITVYQKEGSKLISDPVIMTIQE